MPSPPRHTYSERLTGLYLESRRALKIDWTSYEREYWRRVFKRVYALYGQSDGQAIVIRLKQDRWGYRSKHPNNKSEIMYVSKLVLHLLGYMAIGAFNVTHRTIDGLSNFLCRWRIRSLHLKDKLIRVSGKRPRR